MKILGRCLILFCIIISFGCSPAINCDSNSCLHILFIGNSYTYVNDLPGTFAKLANAGGHPVDVEMEAQGGWSLSEHLNSSVTLDKISSSKWNFVALQEQSEIPAVEQSRTQEMFPAARSLVQRIEQGGAQPILFLTWAHRDGLPAYGMNNYDAMQFQINQGYLGMAQELNVPVAPVGVAWTTVRGAYPQLTLWQDDGSHPTMTGTYLAACVFYAVIFRQSPAGLNYTAGLPNETAQSLQTIAGQTVLQNPGEWNLR